MLKTQTLEELYKVAGFDVALQVARLDAVMCTKKLKKRHYETSGLLLNEVTSRLAHVGVTNQTRDIHRACVDFEITDSIRGCSGNEIPESLQSRIAKLIPTVARTTKPPERRLQYFDLITSNWVNPGQDQIDALISAAADHHAISEVEALQSLSEGGQLFYADHHSALLRFFPVKQGDADV